MTALDWFLIVCGWIAVVFLICGGVHIGQVGRRRRPKLDEIEADMLRDVSDRQWEIAHGYDERGERRP